METSSKIYLSNSKGDKILYQDSDNSLTLSNTDGSAVLTATTSGKQTLLASKLTLSDVSTTTSAAYVYVEDSDGILKAIKQENLKTTSTAAKTTISDEIRTSGILRIPNLISLDDDNNTILAVWESRKDSPLTTPANISLGISTDGGNTFSQKTLFSSSDWLLGGTILSCFSCRNPTLIQYGSYVYAFCLLANDSNYEPSFPTTDSITHDIVYKYSSDNGSTWSSAVSLKTAYSAMWSDFSKVAYLQMGNRGIAASQNDANKLIIPITYITQTSSYPWSKTFLLVMNMNDDGTVDSYSHSEAIPYQSEEARLVELNNDLNDELHILAYSRDVKHKYVPVYKMVISSDGTMGSWEAFWPSNQKLTTNSCCASMQAFKYKNDRFGVMSMQPDGSARDRLTIMATHDWINWHEIAVMSNTTTNGYSSIFYNENNNKLYILYECKGTLRFEDISDLIPIIVCKTENEFSYFVQGTTAGVTASTYSRGKDGMDTLNLYSIPSVYDAINFKMDVFYSTTSAFLLSSNYELTFYGNGTTALCNDSSSSNNEYGTLTATTPIPDLANATGVKFKLDFSSGSYIQPVVTGYSADSTSVNEIITIKDVRMFNIPVVS